MKNSSAPRNPCEKPFLWCAQDVLLKPSVNDEDWGRVDGLVSNFELAGNLCVFT